jgi:hypothetical protein
MATSSADTKDERGVMHAYTQPTPDFKDYHEWYNTEHGPSRVGCDFIETGNRYVCYYADPELPLDPPHYLALYDLSRLSGLNEQQYTRLTPERSAREDDVFKNGKLNFLERRIYKTLSSKGTYDGPAPILLTVVFVVEDSVAEEFNRWYEEVTSSRQFLLHAETDRSRNTSMISQKFLAGEEAGVSSLSKPTSLCLEATW